VTKKTGDELDSSSFLTEIGILLGLVGEELGVDVGNCAKNQPKF